MGKGSDLLKRLKQSLKKPQNQERLTTTTTSSAKDEQGDEERSSPDAGTSSSTQVEYSGLFPILRIPEVEGMKGSRNLTIILVHGLGGHWKISWECGDFSWIKSFLAPDLQKAGLSATIWSYGYDSRTNTNSVANVEDAATELLGRIRNREGNGPVIFVCHSLGGLVVKKAINLAHTNNRRYGELLDNIKGCVFLGVPHRGADHVWWKTNAGHIIELTTIGAKGNNEFANSIKRSSHVWKDIAHDFKHRAGQLGQIHSFYERRKIGPVLIVDRESAEMGLEAEEVHPTDSDHVNISKFDRHERQRYQPIGDAINELAQRAVSETEECTLDEKTEKLKDEILEFLSFPDIDRWKSGVKDAYTETFSWALETDPKSAADTPSAEFKLPTFLEWVESSQTIFWVSGKPGCGKSTLMKYVYQNPKMEEALAQWAGSKRLVLASHFFIERGSDLLKSREGMARSILRDVLRTRRDLIPIVYRHLFNSMSPPSASLHTWAELIDALNLMLDNLGDSKVCIFADGLDEYRIMDRINEYQEKDFDLLFHSDSSWGGSSHWIRDGHKEVADFFCQLGNRDNIKICLASRELPEFEHQFRQFPRLRVHDWTMADIFQYCKGTLDKEAPDLGGFASRIAEKSKGVFLWVRIVVNMLVDGYNDGNESKQDSSRILASLPVEIGKLYLRIMENIQKDYLPESSRIFELVLTHQSIKPDPEKFDIVTLFLAVDGHVRDKANQELVAKSDEFHPQSWEELRPRWTRLQHRLKSRCGGLLEGTEDVQFMHQTAKDFISRRDLWDRIFSKSPGFESGMDVTLALLSGYIRRLKCCQEALPRVPSAEDSIKDLDSLWNKGLIHGYPYALIDGSLHYAKYCELEWESSEKVTSIAPYVQLVDELDITGKQLVDTWKGSFPVSFKQNRTFDWNWTEVFFDFRYYDGLSIRLPFSFLHLAVSGKGDGIPLYINSKVRGGKVPKAELQNLLLHASRAGEVIFNTKKKITRSFGVELRILRTLLDEGVDPNYEYQISRPARSPWAEVKDAYILRTPWTFFLQSVYRKESRFGLDKMIQGVRLFLNYKADPAVRWLQKDRSGKRAKIMTATPEIVIAKVLARELAKSDMESHTESHTEDNLKDDLAVILNEIKEAAARSRRTTGGEARVIEIEDGAV